MITSKEAREKATAAAPIRVAREEIEYRKIWENISAIVEQAAEQGIFSVRIGYDIKPSFKPYEKKLIEELRKKPNTYIVVTDYEFPDEEGAKRGKKIGIKISW